MFGNGWPNHVYNHARRLDHGYMTTRRGGQYFWDDYGCSSTDDSAAIGGTFSNSVHMRWEVAWTETTGQSYSATPHYEEWDWEEWTHCVRPGGFAAGRSYVYDGFVNGGGHTNAWPNYWGNTEYILKCDGQWVNGDGYVYYISMYGNDPY